MFLLFKVLRSKRRWGGKKDQEKRGLSKSAAKRSKRLTTKTTTAKGSMCVSILLNLLWLLPVTLLDTISAGDSTKSPLCQASPSHIYSIPVLPAPDRNYTGVGRFSSSSAINCSDSGRLVAVKVQMHSNRHTARGNPWGTASAHLLVCFFFLFLFYFLFFVVACLFVCLPVCLFVLLRPALSLQSQFSQKGF